MNPMNDSLDLDMDLNRITTEYEYAFHFLYCMNSKTSSMMKN
jgi:hypothetical protein